ncbi:MAG: hypothetical protein J7647_31315 [Cyanobacteria bacterium SBLK]|nr:hypothetical protein [Cyanobacteria bacterium SBLK]
METAQTKNLQRIVIVASSLGILTIAGFVAIASVVPLSRRLRQAEEKNLIFAASTRKLVVEEYLSKAREVAAQITSRTRARRLLESFNQGEISLEEFASATQRILTDALQQSEEVVGITRLDRDRQARANVGLPIPPEVFVIPPEDARVPLAEDLADIEGTTYLAIGAPILNSQKERVGTDIVLYSIDRLQDIVFDYTGLGETGEMVLADNRRNLVFPLRDGRRAPSETLKQALESSISGQTGLLNLPSGERTISYNALENSSWGLAVQMNRAELYQPLNRQLRQISGIILGLTVLGSGGIVLLLQPIARRTIGQAEFLEGQMRDREELLLAKNAQLQQEEQTRQLVEDILHQMDELQETSRQVAEFSSAATQVSRQGFAWMQEGLAAIAQTQTQIEQLQKIVETLSVQIERLNENTRQIGSITDLVNELGAQTNMLALNATIEAVRAGEQGKGFSVVAMEIRKLADRSRESVEQINRQLGTIQASIQSMSGIARGGNKQAVLSQNATQQAVRIFQKMQQAIDEVQKNSLHISRATDEQAIAISRVVRAMPEIEQTR